MDSIAAARVFTRRKMIAGLGAGAAAAAAGATGLSLSWSPTNPKKDASWWDRTFLSLRNGSAGDWSRLDGETFVLAGASGAALKVVLVRNLPSAGARPKSVARSQAFAVTFEASGAGAPEGDRTYEISHPTHGTLPIYLGAAAAGRQTARLVAVFN
jgi:hypothetical protein